MVYFLSGLASTSPSSQLGDVSGKPSQRSLLVVALSHVFNVVAR